MPDHAAVIELVKVARHFGGNVRALRDVSLSVKAGERVVLLGRSGCGKTTLLRLVNGLLEPTRGCVRFNGMDLRSVDPVALRRKIGYVIQQAGLFPHLSVLDNIGLPLRLLGWGRERRRARATGLMRLVRLPLAFLRRYPRELSGGQQQRVGLARALATDPEVLLMDEPFGALDPLTRIHVRNDVLALLRKIRKTVVMVTHDVVEAVEFGTRIVVLHSGRIEQTGTPKQVVSRPATPFVREFLVGLTRAPMEN